MFFSYGELGSVIIHQTLYDLFPPASIDPNLNSPLTVNEFIQRILVPEVGVRLIMEDQGLEGEEGMETAVCILRESANYGVAMFPEDGGEWGGGRGRGRKGEDEEMGVADRIVMERARKRRKELEEEEGGEETEIEMGELQVASDMEIEGGKQTKRSSRRKKELEPSKKAKEVDSAPAVVPRPKPRPLGKTSSSASVLTSGKDFDTTPHGSQSVEEDVDLDVAEPAAPIKPRLKRKPSNRHSPTVSDLGQQTDTESDTEKMTRLSAAIYSGSTFLDLCSTDEDAEGQDGKTAGKATRARKKRATVATKRPAPEPVPEAEDTEDDSVELVIPLETPEAKRIRHGLVEHEDELEETPRPPGSSYVSRTPSATDSSFHPLRAAQERKKRSGTVSE
jgi:RTC4-like domain